ILLLGVGWLFWGKGCKILEYIGKLVNGVFVMLVGIVVVVGFMGGMGGISDGGVSGDYRNRVLVKGFMDGYNRLEGLG
ncbi:branched-chain amino acid transport system II carrier protein, partial [Staphylococcus epidermidis]|uniref:branched-chain amino acid transport system II carrier protein n=1 Tax=Staphylococcus epidermidis TaxID=1282 RepID=UPI0021B45F6A